jgi:metallophosphoesterase (TIGR00282 family)
MIKVLFIGDVVGSPGRKILKKKLIDIKRKYKIDFIIVNGENMASGKGITKKIALKMKEDCGIDLITVGNHAWSQKNFLNHIDSLNFVIRPHNFFPSCPGMNFFFKKIKIENKNSKKIKIGVMILLGGDFPFAFNSPFSSFSKTFKKNKLKIDILIVEIHSEYTAEKYSMGYFLDGKVSAVIGTHTHVQTNDSQILPKGTGYCTDVGMTGAQDGIIGFKKETILKRFTTGIPQRFSVLKKTKKNKIKSCIITISSERNDYNILKCKNIKNFTF